MLFLLLQPCLFIQAQKKPAYILYNGEGHKVSYHKMIGILKKTDIILFGEYHNNAIAHWLELELAKDLQPLRKLEMGAEMFESDNQEAVNLYLRGAINAHQLDSMARLWKNFKTDYQPLLDFARDHGIDFTATNIPRHYASQVAKYGFSTLDSLPDSEKKWMAPLPMRYDAELPGYKNMLTMMPGHGGENLPKAQNAKDATMAYFIMKYHKPGDLFIHYNGSYHSQDGEGIIWHLRQINPALKIGSITVVTQKDITHLEQDHKHKAGFIICVDEDMTNTY